MRHSQEESMTTPTLKPPGKEERRQWRQSLANMKALRRARPKKAFKCGDVVPSTSPFYEEPKFRTPEYPTLAEMALLHRHFAATSQKNESGIKSKRTLAEMSFLFSWRNAQHIVEGDGWAVSFFAMGCPDGWRYRYHGKSGDLALMRVALERIRRRFDHYAVDYPFAIKLPRANYWKAKAWCADRYPEGSWCYHRGSWRFASEGPAVEMKLFWG
jgi:hypothetical protein